MYKFVHFIYSKSKLKVKKQEIRNKVFIKEGVCPVCDGATTLSTLYYGQRSKVPKKFMEIIRNTKTGSRTNRCK